MKKVFITSENPVKIFAITGSFSDAFKEEFNFIPISVSSDVRDQPIGDGETALGSFNRCLNAKKELIKDLTKDDFIVGIEGGISYKDNQGICFACITIMQGDDHRTIKTQSFPLPHKVVKLCKQGMELGDADDIVFQNKNSKQKSGAIGILTNGLIDREQYYYQAIVIGLIPFLNSNLYNG